jgi:hypothetical protein
VTIWAALINACHAGLIILVTVLIHSRGGSPALVGAVNAFGAVGGLAGALVAAKIVRKVPGRLLIIVASSHRRIVASWLMAAVVAGIAFVSRPWAVGGLLALMMFLVAPLNVLFSTYQMRIVPDALMGRASSAVQFGASSIRWVGALAACARSTSRSTKSRQVQLAQVLSVSRASEGCCGAYGGMTGVDDLPPGVWTNCRLF